jgi:hypothetical protein
MTRCELLRRMAAALGAFVITVLAKAAILIELGHSRLRPQPASPR